MDFVPVLPLPNQMLWSQKSTPPLPDFRTALSTLHWGESEADDMTCVPAPFIHIQMTAHHLANPSPPHRTPPPFLIELSNHKALFSCLTQGETDHSEYSPYFSLLTICSLSESTGLCLASLHWNDRILGTIIVRWSFARRLKFTVHRKENTLAGIQPIFLRGQDRAWHLVSE